MFFSARYAAISAFNFRIRQRNAAAGLVAINAGAGLLAVAALFGKPVNPVGLLRIGIPGLASLLADAPANVYAGEVAHGELAHRKAEIGQDLVNLLRARAFIDQ